jgi:hypothetical protein
MCVAGRIQIIHQPLASETSPRVSTGWARRSPRAFGERAAATLPGSVAIRSGSAAIPARGGSPPEVSVALPESVVASLGRGSSCQAGGAVPLRRAEAPPGAAAVAAPRPAVPLPRAAVPLGRAEPPRPRGDAATSGPPSPLERGKAPLLVIATARPGIATETPGRIAPRRRIAAARQRGAALLPGRRRSAIPGTRAILAREISTGSKCDQKEHPGEDRSQNCS